MIGKVAIVLLLSSIYLGGCVSQPVSDDGLINSRPNVSIMTFNVENLFDTNHDDGKNDYTYLPLSSKSSVEHRQRCAQVEVKRWREQCLYWDWTESAVAYKLRTISDVIRQGNGKGPDIIAFQEVENFKILERLRTEYLADLGYRKPILIEGKDLRGIDVAFMSRFPLASKPKLHAIDFQSIDARRRDDTRGILQADFKLPDNTIISGFAVHFPAPFHPYLLRIDSYKTLNNLMLMLPPDRLAFAAGDFNTPSGEDSQYNMLASHVKPHWLIAHQEACDRCSGTHYYAPKKEWSFLDMLIVKKFHNSAFVPAWRLDSEQTRVINNSEKQIDENGFPKRFELKSLTGVSDHWPLLIELKSTEFR